MIDGDEVFAVDVFDQRIDEGLFGRLFADDDDRDLGEPGFLGRPPAALASDDR